MNHGIVRLGSRWLAVLLMCGLGSVPLAARDGPARPAAKACEVERLRGVSYYAGPRADAFRHQLDVFLPKGRKNYPVVVLVHGGAWVMGNNRCCGLYSAVGEFLASQGIGAVLPNYRLSPAVKHPEHVKDVARALAWTHAHIADHGGCPDQIFLAGHSAGGHLVSLLATDDSYLKAERLQPSVIKGVISASGVYRIPPGNMEVTLGGSSAQAFRLDELAPFRGRSGHHDDKALFPVIPLRLNVFGPAFGNDPRGREAASPLHHVRPGLPPFLIFTAAHELPGLADMAEEFHAALLSRQCESQLLPIDSRNHNSLMFRAITPDDPVARSLLHFIHRHAAPASQERLAE